MIEDLVREHFPLLKPSVTVRAVCPACEADHEKSFAMRRDSEQTHKVWFRCYRAKCGVSGSLTDVGGLRMSVVPEERAELGNLEPVPHRIVKSLALQLQVPEVYLVQQGMQWEPMDESVAYPIFNYIARRPVQVGWQMRRWTEKVIRNHYHDTTARHYTMLRDKTSWTGKVYVVENIWSMYKLGCIGVNAVSLMGHDISPTLADYMRPLAHEEVILLLDPDTWPAATVDALRAFEASGVRASARRLTMKPHRMRQEELREVVGE